MILNILLIRVLHFRLLVFEAQLGFTDSDARELSADIVFGFNHGCRVSSLLVPEQTHACMLYV